MDDSGREVEWQFDADDLTAAERWLADAEAQPVCGITVGTATGAVQHDEYLETSDRRLMRSGYSLRIRRTEGRTDVVATLKATGGTTADAGLRDRAEHSERVAAADPPAALAASQGPVGRRLRSLIGRRRLAPRFTVTTARTIHPLLLADRPCGEVAVDDTAITSAARPTPTTLRRIEVEYLPQDAAAIGPFVDAFRAACALRPATQSKFEAGAAHARLRPPAIPDVGPTALGAKPTIGELALVAIRRQLVVIAATEPGTRLGDDIEELHDMRVACRRTRAAISLFRDVLPADVLALDGEVKWLAGVLGAVRDLDVQLAQLASWSAGATDADLGPIHDLLDRRREVARRALLSALDSRRYASLISALRAAVAPSASATTKAARRPARRAVARLIDRRYRRFRAHAAAIGPASPDEALHRLRIDAKRLRYALEFAQEIFPKVSWRPRARLAQLQDLLGLHQDAATAIERLRALATDHAAELAAPTIFALGELTERYRHQMADLRDAFPATYRRVRRCDWAALRG